METQPAILPYVPFPSFEEFVSTDFDKSTFEQFRAILEQAKSVTDSDLLDAAVSKATRWAAVDTGAIEGLYAVDRGFTYSVAAEAAAWDNMHQVMGAEAKRAIEDALSAYNFVLDIATKSRPITEAWIRQLHEVICAAQDTYKVITAVGVQEQALTKGAYKQNQNNPLNLASNTIHSYAPVEETAPEMHRMVEELSSDAFAKAHPVLQAAYAHYAFVCVHPFPDGNGRVARALSSVFFYRSPGVPLVIFADQKHTYLDALELADGGEYESFIRFLGERAIDVVRMVVDDLKRPVGPTAAERMERLRRSLVGRGGLPHEEIDAMAGLLFDEWHHAIESALAANPVEHPLVLRIQIVGMNSNSRVTGFRNSPQARVFQLIGTSAQPAYASLVETYSTMISVAGADVADFIVVASPSRMIREVLVRDLYPNVSPSLTYRLDMAAEEEVVRMIDMTASAAEKHLRSTGYLL